MLASTVEQSPGEWPGNENKGGEDDEEVAGERLHPQAFGINRNERRNRAIGESEHKAGNGNRNRLRLDEVAPMPG